MITKLYRRLVPSSARYFIYTLFLGNILSFIRDLKSKEIKKILAKDIVNFYDLPDNSNRFPQEYKKAADWIKNNGFAMFPYDYTAEYKSNIEVYKSAVNGLYYVNHQGKKLYFPRGYTKRTCENYYNGLCAEQDKRSPHRYNYDYFKKDDSPWTVLDLGAAEGIFALSVIDYVDKVYLFECDEKWLEALNMTFEPYMDKVEIINKYVSNTDTITTITLNTFLKDRLLSKIYIKMDIEGAELLVLEGADQCLNNTSNIFISVCTYHLDGIGKEIESYLEKSNFDYCYTKGVMAFGTEPPYFRKGIIYAKNFN